MEQFIFWISASITIFASIMVVTRKNPIYSALFMLVAFSAIAVIFLQLSAPFIAAMHLMVYAGAIMVLFLFVIMLLNLRKEEFGKDFSPAYKNIAGLLSVTFFVIFGVIIGLCKFSPPQTIDTVAGSPKFGSAQSIGTKIFSEFVLPFELLSILIIVAIIGAVILAKKKV